MFTLLAVLVYFCAFALPVLLLYRFHSGPWHLHLLAILAALGMGSVRIPASWSSPAFDIVFGATFVFLVVWGIGGLLAFRWHRAKHA